MYGRDTDTDVMGFTGQVPASAEGSSGCPRANKRQTSNLVLRLRKAPGESRWEERCEQVSKAPGISREKDQRVVGEEKTPEEPGQGPPQTETLRVDASD